MKVGRNEPCPCGSGKKYKQCCLARDEAESPEELAWRRVRRANEGLASALLRTADAHFGPTALDEAWEEFNLWETDEPFDDETPYLQVFMPWFLYHWLPEPEETEVPAEALGEVAARAYLRTAGKRLDPLAARYVEAALGVPFSFHEVLARTPGRSIHLRDVLLGTEAEVMEASASKHVEAGDLLYAKVVPIEGIAMLEGCSPVALPPGAKPEILALREKLRPEAGPIDHDVLAEWDIELRDLYLALADQVLYPQAPRMTNTDGEPIELRTLVYDIDSPADAFDALADLSAGLARDDLLEGAEFDADHVLTRAAIPWRRASGAASPDAARTILGMLRISPGRLEAEVNSAARDERLRALIAERLGDRARFRVAKVQSVEALRERKDALEDVESRRAREAERGGAAASPEVRAAVNEVLRRHYRNWLDDEIPALGHRTPREAVKEASGREAVEALVRQIERDGARMQPPLDPDIVREMRAALGLEQPATS